VIGHVGRFAPQKKQAFLVEVAAEAAKLNDRVHLLLVGDGPLRPEAEKRAAELGITNRVTFAGGRDDVPAIMIAAIDVFVLPSLFEGLPLVLLEAQAAGRPCLVSHRVSHEADVVHSLISRMELERGATAWAVRALTIASNALPDRAAALAEVDASSFNIRRSAEIMTQLYEGGLKVSRMLPTSRHRELHGA
jgi:glycosyltransferase involved in cell wall biosynthesis